MSKKPDLDDTEAQRREIERGLRLLRRQQAIQMSRTNFMSFVKFTSPDPADPDDTTKSTYENALHHDAVAAALEEVEKGNYQFLILTMPPRHGKQLADDTLVPTPFGYVCHGDLQPGDYVFGPDGMPVSVTAIGPETEQDVEIEFTNGEIVRCHERHEWTVFDRRSYPPRRRTVEHETLKFRCVDRHA